LLQVTHRLAEAEPLMRRVIAIHLDFERSTGHTHPHLKEQIANYKALLKAMGRRNADIRATLDALQLRPT
jgi:hypothetical protein